MHHAVLRLLAIELQLKDLLFDSVAALLRESGDLALCARRQQDLVLAEERVLEHGTEDITTGDLVADLQLRGLEVPLLLAVEGGYRDAAWDVDAVCGGGDGLERALDAVVDGLHETWTQLDGERLARSHDGIANCDAGGLFVDLDGRLVLVEADDLTDEVVMADRDL